MLGVRTFNANQVDAVAYDIAYHCLCLRYVPEYRQHFHIIDPELSFPNAQAMQL